MKNSIWKDEKEKFYILVHDEQSGELIQAAAVLSPAAHWIIIRGGEKKVVHIMQTVDTCMQYWRQKIIKIRGQSLSSRFFSLIILITDCPPPSNAIAFWPIWTLPSSEGILSDCELLSSEFTLVYLQRRGIHWWCCVPQVYKYEKVYKRTLHKYASMCKYTKNASMCKYDSIATVG